MRGLPEPSVSANLSYHLHRRIRNVFIFIFYIFAENGGRDHNDVAALNSSSSCTLCGTYVEAAGQMVNQTNESVYLGGNVNHNADLSI